MPEEPKETGASNPEATMLDSQVDSLALEVKNKSQPEFRLDRGQAVHRYVVLYQLGSGGMGIVYAAYDPELDRKIALKLLHADGSGSRGRTRLLREAKACAKLNHSNVVTVHDVGTFQGRVFVAMEFVDGVTLRQWLREKTRTWSEVVKVLTAAGRGLAAAHAADLIHRDFKPDNVLVDRQGRVVVLDFGLARRAGSRDDHGPSATIRPLMREQELDIELTRTGALIGTPAYMAPEQHLSEATDARADQFSFCVVLWESLYGIRPFKGENAIITAAQVLKGKIAEPPKGIEVPGFLRRAMTRGLSVKPEERHPSITALLQEIGRNPHRRRRRVLAAGALVALVAGGGYGLFRASTDGQRVCSGSQQRLSGIWDDVRKLNVRQAFVGTGLPYATSSWVGVQAELDRYTEQWVQMHTEACEATHIHREQSEDVLDLRMACLRTRLSQVTALTDQFVLADAGTVQNAIEAVSSLPRIAVCGDLEALRSRVRPPEEPGTRQRVEQLRDRLSRAGALNFSGAHAQALGMAQDVAREAASLEYPPIEAEAKLRLGQILERKGDYEGSSARLLEAIWAAEASRHEEVAAQAWVRLVWVAGVEQSKTDDGVLWAEFARAAIGRVRGDELLDATLTHNLGGVLYRQGRFPEAREHYERALAVQKRLLGPRDPAVAMTLNHIGNVLIMQGSLDEARKWCEDSLAMRRTVLGADHPKVAASLNNIAAILHKQKRYDGAVEFAEKALRIVGGSSGPEETVALVLVGQAKTALGDHPGAQRSFERLVEARVATHGPDEPVVVTARRQLADAMVAAGHGAAAAEVLERAARSDASTRRAEAAKTLAKKAEVEVALGTPQAARATFARVVDLLEAADSLDDAAQLLLARARSEAVGRVATTDLEPGDRPAPPQR